MNVKHDTNQVKSHGERNIALGFVMGMLLGGLIDAFSGDSGIATIIGMISGSLIGSRMRFRFHMMEYPRQSVRYLLISGASFLMVFLSSIYLLEKGIRKPFQVVVAFAPIIPAIIFVASLGLAIVNMDEVQREIQQKAIMVAFAMTALITITFGLFGMIGGPQPNWLFIPFIMVVSWLTGKMWFRWRYSK